MKFILLSITMISASCGTEVMAEPEQGIIKQEAEKSILYTPIGDSVLFFYKLLILIFVKPL